MFYWQRACLTVCALGCLAGLWLHTKEEATAASEQAVDESKVAAVVTNEARSRAPNPATSSSGAPVDPDGPEARAAMELAERERMRRDRELYMELRDKPQRSALETHLMRNLEDTSRHPPTNQRFASLAHDPVARRNLPDRRSRRSQDQTRDLSVWTSANQVDLGNDLQVFAELRDAGGGELVDGELTLFLAREGETRLLELPFARDGKGGFSATIDSANVAGRPLPQGFYTLQVRGPAGLFATTSFGVRPAYARLTGAYRDYLDEGDLVIEAQLDAYEAGRFLVLATLYTDDDIPIGMAQTSATLSEGATWVTLRFHGLLVRDGGRHGPFRLGHITVDKQGFPLSTGVEAEPKYQTQAYELSDFSERPYNPLSASLED